MNEPAVPAAAPAVNSAAGRTPDKLDDLMLAMDVVDTLRHRDVLAERALGEDAREAALIERLRGLYESQGIDVSDAVLREGVRALNENRFAYTPAPPGLARNLAWLWVKRGAVAGWFIGIIAALGIGASAYQLGIIAPAERAAQTARSELKDTLPKALDAALKAVLSEAQVDAARQRASALANAGKIALERGNAEEARGAVAALDQLTQQLRLEFTLRIPARPEDQTGFARENNAAPGGRGLYVVVDAADLDGNPVKLRVRNEETGDTDIVSHFAVRVPSDTFQAIRADKQRNGILQRTRLAEKRRGFLEPDYLMPTEQGRLTKW